MNEKRELLWTFEDYRRLLRHPNLFVRDWAADRIEDQYPALAPAEFIPLLTDADPHLRVRAAITIRERGDRPEFYEPALLAALPGAQGTVRGWLWRALAGLHSVAILPELLAAVGEVRQARPLGKTYSEVMGAIEALGQYPEPEARAALWELATAYPFDDMLMGAVYGALLAQAEPDAVMGLVPRLLELKPSAGLRSATPLGALARAAGVQRLAEELSEAIPAGHAAVWGLLEGWLDQPVPVSTALDQALQRAARHGYKDILPDLAQAMAARTQQRGDDLTSWQAAWAAGERPVGYRWRTLLAYQLTSAFAQLQVRSQAHYRDLVGLSLALYGQLVLDEDDEAALAAAGDDATRREVLLRILAADRENVLSGVVDRVAAYGPDVLPALQQTLGVGEDIFWPGPRALAAITEIARSHPGSADALVPAILAVFAEDQSDYILEAAGPALAAIGPAAIGPIAQRLDEGSGLDTYGVSALGMIPVPASVDALIDYAGRSEDREWVFENLVQLGDRRSFDFMRHYYTPDGTRLSSLLSQFLYTLAVLHDYQGPEMAEWHASALEMRALYNQTLDEDPSQWLGAAGLPATVTRSAPTGRSSDEQRRKKRRRAQAKATKKAQRKRKKK